MPTTCSATAHSAHIPDTAAGQRLDVVLAGLFPEHSRSRLSGWIKSGAVRLNGKTARPRDLVLGGEEITLNAIAETETHAVPEVIALSILHEDDAVLVIDKPAGLVVHPGAGNPSGTLVNALLHHDPTLAILPRAGIVHRLDKDTSGVMVIARTLTAHTALVTQLAARAVKRQYLAVVTGALVSGGSINAAIGRHPRDRLKMTVREDGRDAITHYRLNTRFRAHTALDCHLETGRTHQIRVHMAHLKHPIVGDPLYGGGLKLPRAASPELTDALRRFKRQALHARLLEFTHPDHGKTITCTAPTPADLAALLAALDTDTQAHGEMQRQ